MQHQLLLDQDGLPVGLVAAAQAVHRPGHQVLERLLAGRGRELVERALGQVSTKEAAALLAAQFTGGVVGAVVANLMFELPAIELSTNDRSSGAHWLAEVVATFGLVMIILGVVRAGRASAAAFAVGGYITAAYWFTSSTSFANPAITIGRTLSDTFAGIAPSSAPLFVLMQLLGGLLGLAAAVVLYPGSRRLAEDLTSAGGRERTADLDATDLDLRETRP